MLVDEQELQPGHKLLQGIQYVDNAEVLLGEVVGTGRQADIEQAGEPFCKGIDMYE